MNFQNHTPLKKSCSFILFFFLCFASISCDNTDVQALQADRDRLAKELDEEKYGAGKLLDEAKKLEYAGEVTLAEEKLNLLFSKHADKPEAIEGHQLMAKIEQDKLIERERKAWSEALRSEDPSSTQNYISSFPTGKHISEARERLATLTIKQEKSDFEFAERQNSSSTWKEFLEKYPERKDESTIRKKIIAAEVDEILRDRETGGLPSFQQVGFNTSTVSTISIKNDTGCDLTVRYSGDDIKMIEIPTGETRTISLSSGNYKIAASACGSNYAGSESLMGSYTSRYYFETRRF